MQRMVAQLLVKFTDDADQLFAWINQKRNLDDTDSTLTTPQTGKLTLTTLQADKAFNFGDVTNAKYLLIIADAEVQVRINDVASELLTLKPIPAVVADPVSNTQKSSQAALLWLGPTSVQSLFFTSVDTTGPTSVYVALAGEAV